MQSEAQSSCSLPCLKLSLSPVKTGQKLCKGSSSLPKKRLHNVVPKSQRAGWVSASAIFTISVHLKQLVCARVFNPLRAQIQSNTLAFRSNCHSWKQSSENTVPHVFACVPCLGSHRPAGEDAGSGRRREAHCRAGSGAPVFRWAEGPRRPPRAHAVWWQPRQRHAVPGRVETYVWTKQQEEMSRFLSRSSV